MRSSKAPISQSTISLEELLLLDGEAFLVAAYLALLARQPDRSGREYYLSRLRRGHSKSAILREISTSTEARNLGRALPGLTALVIREKLSLFVKILLNRHNGESLLAAVRSIEASIDGLRYSLTSETLTPKASSSHAIAAAPTQHSLERESQIFAELSLAKEYISQVLAVSNKPTKGYSLDFVARQPETWKAPASRIKAIAFYLPQFHPIPENDKWWGKGFTEWTNVSKASPQYIGHYQPHLPGELGFYDLRLVDVMRQQADLARQYGIDGFCFHYYWFGGHRLLERPLNQFIENTDINLAYCICWANENWSRRWDGSENDILMAQNHSEEDDIALIDDLMRAFKDPRYIKIDGRPVLVVYRVSLLPDAKATAQRWKKRCVEKGIAEPYLVAARSFEVMDPRPYGFDATVEFPPHQISVSEITDQLKVVNPNYKGKIYDYREFSTAAARRKTEGEFMNFRGVMPSWDNEARKPGQGHSFAFSSPAVYAKWLRECCAETSTRSNPDERLIFINAWNEWGEGAHLEPDRRFGYAYLHSTANVLGYFGENTDLDRAVTRINEKFTKTSDLAVIFHLYYEEMFEDLRDSCLRYLPQCDVFMSVSRSIKVSRLQEIASSIPSLKVVALNNVGRDIWPLIYFLPHLLQENYRLALKIHTKRSLHTLDGQNWLRTMIESLAGSVKIVEQNISRFSSSDALHVLAPNNSLLDLSETDRNILNRSWLNELLNRLGRPDIIGNYELQFPAGSMYWFRPATFAPINSLGLEESDFEPELGQIDGTLAHAIERLVGFTTILSCGQCKSIDMLN